MMHAVSLQVMRVSG